jgi:hypothetical protein
MATMEISEKNVIFTMEGFDKVLALRGTFAVPLSNIRQVLVRPKEADVRVIDGFVLRVAGGYWPNAFTSGFFKIPNGWAFYDVHEPKNTIGLLLQNQRTTHVFIELSDEVPEAAADRLKLALAR